MNLRSINLLCIMILSFSLFGCSRPKKETTSKINLNFGGAPSEKVGSLNTCSGVCLYHIVLNVSGSGFPTIDLSLDAENLKDGVLNLEVPSGSDRLFQVIAVYYDTTTSSMIFYYGDSVQTLSGGTKDIAIEVKALNQSSSEQGHISGRWSGFDTLPKFPTGELRVMYRPPNGRPAMTIEKSMMVAGWFSAFSIQGLNFDYVVKTLTGESITLFENTNYDTFTASPKLLKVRLPSHYDDGQLEQPVNYVYGYYGNPIHYATKYVCYENTSVNLDRFKKADQSSYNWTELTKDGGTASMTACGGGSFPFQTDTAIKVLPQFLENGKDSSAGYLGIFAGQMNSGKFQIASTVPGSFSVAALPGASVIFDKAVLFTLPQDKQEVFGDGRLPCDAFAKGEHGALRRGELTLLPFGNISTGSHNISMSESNLPYAICPSIQGRVVNGGYFSKGNGSSWPSPTPVPMAANDFDIYTFDKARHTQCRPVRIQLKNGTQFAAADSPKTISLSANGVTVMLYSDFSCTSSLVNPYNLTFSSGESQKDFFYQVSGGSNLIIESTSANNSFSISRSRSVQIEATGGTATKIISLNSTLYLAPNECKDVELMVLDANGYPTNRGLSDTYTLTSNLPADFKLVDNCSTKNLISTVTFGSLEYSKKISVLAGSNNFSNAELSISGGTYAISPIYGNIVPAVNYLTIELKKSSLPTVNYFQNECYEVRVRSNVNNGPQFPIPAKLNVTGGQFYNTSDCSPSAIGTFAELSIGTSVDTSPPVYVKTNLVSHLNIQFDGSYNPFISNPVSNVTINNILLNANLDLSSLTRWYKSFLASLSWQDSSLVPTSLASYGSPTANSNANLFPYGSNYIDFTSAAAKLQLGNANLANYSITILVKPTSINTVNILKFINTSSVATDISTDSAGKISAGGVSSASPLTSGVWSVITVTRSPGSINEQYLSVYVNGVQVISNQLHTLGSVEANGFSYMVGNGTNSMLGWVAEILLHDNALSPAGANDVYQHLKLRYSGLGLP